MSAATVPAGLVFVLVSLCRHSARVSRCVARDIEMIMFPVNCAQLVLLLRSSRSLSHPAWLAVFVVGRHGLSDAFIGDMAGAETSVAATLCLRCRSLLTSAGSPPFRLESTVMLATIPNTYSFGRKQRGMRVYFLQGCRCLQAL